MVRAGLGAQWNCLFANDFDHKKSRTYKGNWGSKAMKTADVGTLSVSDLPGHANLVWASFPCQDLSLAGGGAGLKGNRSGTFWPFWKLTQALIADGRGPRMIVLENVCGTLTSHDGNDFNAICSAVQDAGYVTGAVVVDASLFVPQSRPRLFVICVQDGIDIPVQCFSPPLSPHGTPESSLPITACPRKQGAGGCGGIFLRLPGVSSLLQTSSRMTLRMWNGIQSRRPGI